MSVNLDRLLGDNWLSQENWINYNKRSYWVWMALKEMKEIPLDPEEGLATEMEGLKKHLSNIIMANNMASFKKIIVKDESNINDLFESAMIVSPLNNGKDVKEEMERSLLLRSRCYVCPRVFAGGV